VTNTIYKVEGTAVQFAFAFEPPPGITTVHPRECWMEECRCQNRPGSLEHQMWFWIRWYVKHLLTHQSDAKYLATVREWIRSSEPKGLYEVAA